MKKNLFGNLQLFAAPEGMTGTEQINVQAREIDFVTSFANDFQALLDIMGITNMIEKQNGTILKKKTVTGTLQDGEVDEGDEIPYSQYTVSETPVGELTLKKYRKGVPAEAIAEKGYAAAVADTDAEFKNDLTNVVLGTFYDQLEAGTLTGTEDSFLMAVAMSIGRVKDKFKTMHKTVTGVAVWVNTLDLYEYLGGTEVVIHTAFGLDYIKNFLGADVVFISSEFESGKVYATPFNNMVCYHINPANSEFAQAGLSYVTDAETGLIGFHTEGNYGRALSEAFALMGLMLFAEYEDGIANTTISASV